MSRCQRRCVVREAPTHKHACTHADTAATTATETDTCGVRCNFLDCCTYNPTLSFLLLKQTHTHARKPDIPYFLTKDVHVCWSVRVCALLPFRVSLFFRSSCIWDFFLLTHSSAHLQKQLAGLLQLVKRLHLCVATTRHLRIAVAVRPVANAVIPQHHRRQLRHHTLVGIR